MICEQKHKIIFRPQASFIWFKEKRSDFYFPKTKYYLLKGFYKVEF